jgi:hypothetical protein
MLAQVKLESDQDSNVVSDDGVGAYKLTLAQLEDAGYLKPGTVEFYLSDGTATPTEILTSPSVWTGQAGVTNVNVLLADPKLQAAVQTDLYQSSLQQLRSAGIVTGNEEPAKLAGLVQAGSKYGPTVVKSWVQGTLDNSTTVTDVNQLVRGAQYAVELSNQKISDALKGFSTVQPGSTVTTDRGAIDDAVRAVIGNDKVTTPNYSGFVSTNTEVSNTALLEAQLSQVNSDIASVESQIASLNSATQSRSSGAITNQNRARLFVKLEELQAQQADLRNQLFI